MDRLFVVDLILDAFESFEGTFLAGCLFLFLNVDLFLTLHREVVKSVPLHLSVKRLEDRAADVIFF